MNGARTDMSGSEATRLENKGARDAQAEIYGGGETAEGREPAPNPSVQTNWSLSWQPARPSKDQKTRSREVSLPGNTVSHSSERKRVEDRRYPYHKEFYESLDANGTATHTTPC